ALRLDVAQNCRLDSAVRKIKPRSIFFDWSRPGLAWLLRALLMIAPVAMLDLCDLKLDGQRIAVRRQPVDDRASGITQPQQLGDLVERLSRRVVASVANVPVGPEILVLRPIDLRQIKMRVPARDHQRQHRKLQLVPFTLTV